MTKLLEQAIAQLRELPEEDQDAAADVLFPYISSDDRHCVLTPEQIKEVQRIHRDLLDGAIRLATSKGAKKRAI
jgi:hypothetical protein